MSFDVFSRVEEPEASESCFGGAVSDTDETSASNLFPEGVLDDLGVLPVGTKRRRRKEKGGRMK
jgi:hypothetical protein